MKEISELIICDDIVDEVESIIASSDDILCISRIVDGEFLIEDAKFATQKAYISSDKLKCIILAAQKFSNISQNKLLKVIEEPPANVIFKLVAPSKTTILPTILSRLPVVNHRKRLPRCTVDIKNFGLEYIYNTLQQNKGLKPDEARGLIEDVAKAAFCSSDFDMKESDFEYLQECIELLDVGSPATVVLSSALLHLLEIKTRTLHANKKS